MYIPRVCCTCAGRLHLAETSRCLHGGCYGKLGAAGGQQAGREAYGPHVALEGSYGSAMGERVESSCAVVVGVTVTFAAAARLPSPSFY